jgi:small-conductance mechanosensitive channel
MLSAACQTQAQRDTLQTQYVQARQNYWACVNKAFHDDDPQVVALTTQLDTFNKQLTTAVQQMGDISNLLNQITEAVSTAASLAKLVISA